MKKFIAVICLFFVTACSSGVSEISKELETHLKKNNWEKIDLSKVGGTTWGRVCVFGPYSDNKKAEKTLGFKWDLEKKSSLLSSDGINVLAFVEDKNVITHIEHPRSKGDFSKLSGQCFDRANATLVRDKTSKDNLVGFVTTK